VHAKPSGLDDRIVQRAIDVAGSPSRVILAHCYSMPQTIVINAGVDAYWIPMPLADRKRHARMVQQRLQKLADRHSIPAGNILLREGDAALDLPTMARSKDADIVVMGAISRGTLERLVIGSTAERVMDRLDCDVLVVKPRGFKAGAQLETSRRVHRSARAAPRRHAIAAHL
jgi:universal stress protein E